MMAIHKDQIDIFEIFKVIKKRKYLILSCVIMSLIPALYYNHTAIPRFEGSAMVVFEAHQRTPSLGDLFKIDQSKEFVTNQMAEMKTEAFAEAVFNSLSKNDVDRFSQFHEADDVKDKSQAVIQAIRNGLRLDALAKSDVVEISYQHTDPNLAAIVPNRATDVLIRNNLLQMQRTSANVWKLVDDQMRKYEKYLFSSETELKNFKERNNISITPEAESEQIFNRITEAEILNNQIRTKREAAERRLTTINEMLAEQKKDLVPRITQVTSPWIQKLKESLTELEVKYTSLQVQNYTNDHPAMIKLQEQISRIKTSIKEASLNIAKGEAIIDPISQMEKLLEESVTLTIDIETYKAQEIGLRNAIALYNNNLKSVPEKELELERLLRNKEANEQVYLMLLKKREEAKIAESQKDVNYIRVINPAKVPKHPVWPRKMINILVSIIFGLMLGTILAFVPGYLDNKIRTREDLEQITSRNVLALIPKFEVNGNNGSLKGEKASINPQPVGRLIPADFKHPASEAFLSLRTNLQFSGIDRPLKSIAVTSATPRAGKTTISANLAVTMARIGLKTLLIDADMRNPNQHLLFSKNQEPGLANLMLSAQSVVIDTLQRFDHLSKRYLSQGKIIISSRLGRNQRRDIVACLSESIPKKVTPFILQTQIENLFLLPAGTNPPNPADLLASETMSLLFRLFRSNYDMVIFDTPPVLAATDASILSSMVDCSLLVVRSGENEPADVIRTCQILHNGNNDSIGCILNHVKENGGYYTYYYPSERGTKSHNGHRRLMEQLTGR